MIHARLPLMAAALSIAAVISGPARAADPTGLWLSGDGDVKMRIAHCGANICSTIAWLKEPNENGKPKVDKYNADESKRGRPVMGSQIILGMAPDGADKWSGKVYNAEDGKTYTGSITLTGATALELKGCALAGLICKGQIWTKTK